MFVFFKAESCSWPSRAKAQQILVNIMDSNRKQQAQVLWTSQNHSSETEMQKVCSLVHMLVSTMINSKKIIDKEDNLMNF